MPSGPAGNVAKSPREKKKAYTDQTIRGKSEREGGRGRGSKTGHRVAWQDLRYWPPTANARSTVTMAAVTTGIGEKQQ